jgi:hypothetical protein
MRPTPPARVAPLALLSLLVTLTVATHAAGPAPGGRHEVVHPGKGHESHVSAPAVAVRRDGTVLVAWFAQQGHDNHLFLAHAGSPDKPLRVNPEGLTVESLHQPPGLALGPNDEVYLTWSSPKPLPPGGYFASDLRLSRSLDGGRTLETIRVNEDRPISHSFEGLTVAPDGTLILAWIDSREGPSAPRTYVARVVDRGARVEGVTKLDAGETCVCCRVDVASAGEIVAVAWRKVFSGNIRDMVVGVSRNGAQSFEPAALVHADRWKIAACPHRGGSLAMDVRGRMYLAWYTEGTADEPRMLFAASADGKRFGPPLRLNAGAGSVPDHVRVAADRQGRVVVVWEEATAVRRRVLFRSSTDGGRTLGASRVLSQAIKAYAPDVAATADGRFVVAWHEEQFPSLKTIVQTVDLPK